METHRPSLYKKSLGILIFLISVGSARAAGRKPLRVEFMVDPSTVTAGRTLQVSFRSDTALHDPVLTFNGRRISFFPKKKGMWRALVGVPTLESPGSKVMSFEAAYGALDVFRATATFCVEEGSYPVSRVPLSKEKDSLVSSGQLERDGKILAEVYGNPMERRQLWSGFFVMPTTGVVTSVFGARRAYGDRVSLNSHTGIDIANVPGTSVTAPNRGRVVFAGWLDSVGNVVVLDHGQGIFTYYLHMRKISAPLDALLETGNLVGEMGAEGLATGPHLHWSLVVSGERVDALEWTRREFP